MADRGHITGATARQAAHARRCDQARGGFDRGDRTLSPDTRTCSSFRTSKRVTCSPRACRSSPKRTPRDSAAGARPVILTSRQIRFLRPPGLLGRRGYRRGGAARVGRLRPPVARDLRWNDGQLRPCWRGQRRSSSASPTRVPLHLRLAKAFAPWGRPRRFVAERQSRRFVESLARELDASIIGGVDFCRPGAVGGDSAIRQNREHSTSRPFDRLRTQGRSPGRSSQLFRRRLYQGDGRSSIPSSGWPSSPRR